ncbi:MAG TPA: zeta toxin family protein [Kiritimatiellia bacterium]|nr:zeta toxin family protein [Kiritimatiellia bacterium]
MAPTLIMLAGPNGAGKTTFYSTFLSNKPLPFINADRFAAEFKLNAYEAASLADRVRENFVARNESFISETVFSDPNGKKLELLLQAALKDYVVTLIYIGVSNPELSRERVAARVAAGGHDVPADKLDARYHRSLRNLEKAIRSLPRVILYDNSDFEEPYRFLAEFRSGVLVHQTDRPVPNWATRCL